MGFPLLTSLLQLSLRNTELDDVLHCVNVDNVSILDKGNGSTDLGLRRDVTNAEPVRPIGVSAKKEGRSRLALCLRMGNRDPSEGHTAERSTRSKKE